MTEMTGFAVNQISVQVWVTLGKLLKVSEHQQMELTIQCPPHTVLVWIK